MAGQVVQCTVCGAKTSARFTRCPGCGGAVVPNGTPIDPIPGPAVPQPAPQSPPPVTGPARTNRQAILGGAIRSYTIQGYRVVDRTDTTAQLVKDKKFSGLFALLWFLLFGIGIVIYLIYYAAKRDTILWLEVDGQGQIHTVKSRSRTAVVAAAVATVLVLSCVGLCVASVMSGNVPEEINEATEGMQLPFLPTNTPIPSAAVAPTFTPRPTNTPTPAPEAEGIVPEGTHLVGMDMEPDLYVGQAGDDLLNSCYWARLSNLTGTDDILANENATGLYYVEVLASDKAFETDCKLRSLGSVPARDEFLTVLPIGTYMVGRDIEAGTFQGQAGEDMLDSCYWARLSNASGQDDILANDNATGQYYIEVLATDFALQVECEVKKVSP